MHSTDLRSAYATSGTDHALLLSGLFEEKEEEQLASLALYDGSTSHTTGGNVSRYKTTQIQWVRYLSVGPPFFHSSFDRLKLSRALNLNLVEHLQLIPLRLVHPLPLSNALATQCPVMTECIVLPAYALATQCPVLAERTVLRRVRY
eukprot:3521210-Rhodomonas_salina.2